MNHLMNRIESLKVADVMAQKVVTVDAAQHMVDVASLFIRNQIASAPVIDKSGQCVGILSAFDFLKRDAAGSQGGEAKLQPATPSEPEDTVRSYMSTSVKAVKADASLLQVAHLMCTKHVHRLPVVNGAGKPIGIVSTMDVVAALLNALDEAHQVSSPQ